jgi:hypothetical protein
MKHTPGPWKYALAVVNNAPNIYVVTTGKWGAANIAQCSEDSGEANARLIAAAPDLLAALDALYSYCHGNVPFFGDAEDREQRAVVDQVEAAIARAKGETS